MKAGELRHPISIEFNLATAQDTLGGITESWQTYHRAWGKVVELGGRELEFARQKAPNSTHQVTMRFIPNVTADMRVRHDQRLLNIENVTNVEDRNIELILLCSEAK